MNRKPASTESPKEASPDEREGAGGESASAGRKYVKWSTCQEVMKEEYEFLGELAKR